jgi:diacylglycerol kinase
MKPSQPIAHPPLTQATGRKPLPRRRAWWHQRLVEAEGGYRLGLRANSTLYVHLFAASILTVSGGVLGLSLLDWLLIGLCVAAVMAAELFNAAFHTLTTHLEPQAPLVARQAARLATAATLTIVLAAFATALTVLAKEVWRLFA